MDFDNKIKNSLTDRQKPLPEDFWTKLEPNIPVYSEDKKKPFIGLMSCLGIGLIGLLGAAFVFAFIHVSGTNNDDKINNNADKSTAVTIDHFVAHAAPAPPPQNTSERNVIHSRTVTPRTKNSNTFSSKANTKVSAFDIIPIPSTGTEAYVIAPTSTTPSNNLTPRPSDFTPHPTSAMTSTTTIAAMEKDQTSKPLDTSTALENSRANEIEISALLPKPLITIHTLAEKNHLDLPFSNPIKPASMKRHSIYIDYSMAWLDPTMKPLHGEADSKLALRKKTERTFFSHEVNLAWQYHFNNAFEAMAGLRYTNVQTLFDHREELSSTEDLVFRHGQRVIESTQHIRMIDIMLGLQYQWALSNKMGLAPYVTVAQNLHASSSGKYLDGNQNVSSLQEAEVYKKNMGIDFTTGLKIKYRWSSLHTSVLGLGYRQYFSSFSPEEYGIDSRYKGITAALGWQYAF